jgi:Glyoxalase/Bleomycin resistance protein/Dioxygenase superfamily
MNELHDDSEATKPQPAFLFGQPHHTIVQMAFVVPEIEAAARFYGDLLKLGPWFVRGHFTSTTARYRGEPTSASASLAVAFSGNMQFELVALHDERAAVWREFSDVQTFGFHHYGFGTRRFDDDVAHYEAAGAECVFTDVAPVGGRVAYMDTRSQLHGMVEIIEMVDAKEAFYDSVRAAAAEWDGTDLLRPMP